MNINSSSSVSESISWVGKWTFVLAAAGSAVGLGNIWGFPYKAGTEGGSAFVLIYLGCILVVGLPIMMAEIMIGRRARRSPVNAMKIAAMDSGQSSKWQAVGWGGLVSGILILSFYSVIAGICLNYIGIAAMPNTSISSVEQFNLVTASAPRLLFWHTVFIGFNIAILAAGVIGGIERMVRLLMPTLFVLMIIMVINAMINGDFIRGLSFLFSPNFSDVDATTFLRAMGQAFFSLSLGMGSIMCYGSYMPKEENIFKTSLTVAGLDTLIAILAGLAIFPIIFAYGMEPEAGPGLVFISLLSVFVDMPFGNILGPAFFTLLSIAALSSAISLLEPSVAYFEEEKITSRFAAAMSLGLLAWFIGLGSVLSFNEWSDKAFIGDLNFLDSIDYLANQFLMPIGGMMVAIFAGWFLKPDLALDEFSGIQLKVFNTWRFFIRFISPTLVAAVFIYQLTS
ncbi:sodium-dependent transporter [Gammaproteobacteria bacterium]|nr:sodium-dependent transporter [Gammaproteobacteria bacterium]MDB4000620.1 sodium-dependent transporter [Gammaproteobacteria bacterium]